MPHFPYLPTGNAALLHYGNLTDNINQLLSNK